MWHHTRVAGCKPEAERSRTIRAAFCARIVPPGPCWIGNTPYRGWCIWRCGFARSAAVGARRRPPGTGTDIDSGHSPPATRHRSSIPPLYLPGECFRTRSLQCRTRVHALDAGDGAHPAPARAPEVPFEMSAENQVRHPTEVVPQAPSETARSQPGASPRPVFCGRSRGSRPRGPLLPCSAPLGASLVLRPSRSARRLASPLVFLRSWLSSRPAPSSRCSRGKYVALCGLDGYSRATTAELGGFRGRGTLGGRATRLRLALPSSDPFTEGVTGGARGCGTWRDMSVSDVSAR